MYKKLTKLNFVIGVFFILVSLILFGNILINNVADRLNIYTAVSFMLFGVFMVLMRNKQED
jgi:hypothetical protein